MELAEPSRASLVPQSSLKTLTHRSQMPCARLHDMPQLRRRAARTVDVRTAARCATVMSAAVAPKKILVRASFLHGIHGGAVELGGALSPDLATQACPAALMADLHRPSAAASNVH